MQALRYAAWRAKEREIELVDYRLSSSSNNTSHSNIP